MRNIALRRAIMAMLPVAAGAAVLAPEEAEAIPVPKSAIPRDVLRLARRLERRGATPDEIWRQTGERGMPVERYLGDWTGEVSDEGFSVTGHGRGRVRDFVVHPELQRLFPDLFGARAEFVRQPALRRTRRVRADGTDAGTVENLGEFRPAMFGPGSLRVADNGRRDLTTIHELTHAADFRGGRRNYRHDLPYLSRPHELRAFQAEYALRLSPEERAALPFSAREKKARGMAFARAVPRVVDEITAPPEPAAPRSALDTSDTDRRDRDWWRYDRRDQRALNDDDEYAQIRRGVRGQTYMGAHHYQGARKRNPSLRELRDDEIIDFDKPLSEQNPRVAEVLRELRNQYGRKRPIYYRNRSAESISELTREALDRRGFGGEEIDMLHFAALDGRSADEAIAEQRAHRDSAYNDWPLTPADERLLRAFYRRFTTDPEGAKASAIYNELRPTMNEAVMRRWGGLESGDPRPRDVAFTEKERMALRVLRRNPKASDEELYRALYGDPNSPDGPELKIIQIFRRKLERKLKASLDRDVAKMLRDSGLVGARFRAGRGVEDGQSLIIFDEMGPQNPIGWDGRLLAALLAAMGAAGASGEGEA